MLALGVVIVAISYNKTAQYALIPYGGALVAAHFMEFKITRSRAIIALLCLPFLIIGAELFVANPDKFVSLDSRVKLLHVVFKEFQDHPLRLFTGFGFGHFTDTLLAHFTQIPVALYKSTALIPNWDSLERIDFHCHHQMIESLLALGIGGALFTLALPLLPIYFARDEDIPFALFYTSLWVTISSTWFTLPIHLPFLALALCCSASAGRDIIFPNLTIIVEKIIGNKISIIICAFILFVSFMYFRLEGFQTACIYSKHTYSWVAGKINPPAQLTSELIKRYGALQGLHASNYMQITFQNAKDNPHDLDTTAELAVFKELALTMQHSPLSLRIVTLDILGHERDSRWLNYLKDTLIAAPARFDLAAPYLATLLNTHKLNEAEQFITMLEGINACDPFVYWFKGLLMIEIGGDLKKARALLKDGLDAGIERWIPVSPTLKAMLVGTRHNK